MFPKLGFEAWAEHFDYHRRCGPLRSSGWFERGRESEREPMVEVEILSQLSSVQDGPSCGLPLHQRGLEMNASKSVALHLRMH
eukprot:4652661-Amphidinium_carterae.1